LSARSLQRPRDARPSRRVTCAHIGGPMTNEGGEAGASSATRSGRKTEGRIELSSLSSGYTHLDHRSAGGDPVSTGMKRKLPCRISVRHRRWGPARARINGERPGRAPAAALGGGPCRPHAAALDTQRPELERHVRRAPPDEPRRSENTSRNPACGEDHRRRRRHVGPQEPRAPAARLRSGGGEFRLGRGIPRARAGVGDQSAADRSNAPRIPKRRATSTQATG